MIDPELKILLDAQFGKIDAQFDLVIRTTKEGFDGVDERFDALQRYVDERFTHVEKDIAFLKQRITTMDDELQTLSASMVTKQYLDAKIEALEHRITKSSTTNEALKRIVLMLMLVLERNKLLPSEDRVKYELLLS